MLHTGLVGEGTHRTRSVPYLRLHLRYGMLWFRTGKGRTGRSGRDQSVTHKHGHAGVASAKKPHRLRQWRRVVWTAIGCDALARAANAGQTPTGACRRYQGVLIEVYPRTSLHLICTSPSGSVQYGAVLHGLVQSGQ